MPCSAIWGVERLGHLRSVKRLRKAWLPRGVGGDGDPQDRDRKRHREKHPEKNTLKKHPEKAPWKKHPEKKHPEKHPEKTYPEKKHPENKPWKNTLTKKPWKYLEIHDFKHFSLCALWVCPLHTCQGMGIRRIETSEELFKGRSALMSVFSWVSLRGGPAANDFFLLSAWPCNTTYENNPKFLFVAFLCVHVCMVFSNLNMSFFENVLPSRIHPKFLRITLKDAFLRNLCQSVPFATKSSYSITITRSDFYFSTWFWTTTWFLCA